MRRFSKNIRATKYFTLISFALTCTVHADLDVLILGSSQAVQNEAFSADQIAVQLQNILDGDAAVTEKVNVVFTDIFKSKHISTNIGGSATAYDFAYGCHSLLQYYYWPENQDATWANLSGTAGTDWDYVVLVGDPYIISNMPGYHTLGVHKVAEKAVEGEAQVILCMQWPHPNNNTSQEHFEEFTYRTSQGAKVPISVAPAGLAWDALEASKKENSSVHPAPNGSYLAASSVYATMMNRTASASAYEYDNTIADLAFDTKVQNENHQLYTFPSNFVSPFSACNVKDNVINYVHTGTSTENGVKGGLDKIFSSANVLRTSDANIKYHMNYGRANTYFEDNKRYNIDPDRYMYSFGIPMQDHMSTGPTTMLYGLDSRVWGASYYPGSSENGTDLGVARYMLNEDQAPNARGMVIRSLYAQLKELDPDFNAYGDSWHMSGNLNQAAGSFVYTLLTGRCGMFNEPGDSTSTNWSEWRARRVGYETAWAMMHAMGRSPGFRVMRSAAADTLLTESDSVALTLKFHFKPTHPVKVSIGSSNPTAVRFSSNEFTFTPENYAADQALSLRAFSGPVLSESVDINFITSSEDIAFNQVTDTWKYTIRRDTLGTALNTVPGQTASSPVITGYKIGFHLDLSGNSNVNLQVLDSRGVIIEQYPGARSGYYELPSDKFTDGIHFVRYRWNRVEKAEKILVFH